MSSSGQPARILHTARSSDKHEHNAESSFDRVPSQFAAAANSAGSFAFEELLVTSADDSACYLACHCLSTGVRKHLTTDVYSTHIFQADARAVSSGMPSLWTTSPTSSETDVAAGAVY
jgi:hypothetical protein